MWRRVRIVSGLLLAALSVAGVTYLVAIHPYVQPCFDSLAGNAGAHLPVLPRLAVASSADPGFYSQSPIRSRLTYQLARQSCQTRTSNLRRGVIELALGIRITLRYSHDEIVELYANHLYFGDANGQEVFGIDSASRIFAHVEPQRLSVADSAMLAALSSAPRYLQNRPEKLLERRNAVIDRMAGAGAITRVEADNAKTQPLRLRRPHALAN
jgi:penicillin-binding protein 1A